jgi:hypothetical protein
VSLERSAAPSLEHLSNQGKELLHNLLRGNPPAIEPFRSVCALSAQTIPKHADGQGAIARDYGFVSWAKLKEHVVSLVRVLKPREVLSGPEPQDHAQSPGDRGGNLFRRHKTTHQVARDFGGRRGTGTRGWPGDLKYRSQTRTQLSGVASRHQGPRSIISYTVGIATRETTSRQLKNCYVRERRHQR